MQCGAKCSPGERFCGECGAPRPRLPERFEAVERQFAALKARYAAGELDDAGYDTALRALVIQDEGGVYCMIGAETGQWYRYDGQRWVRSEPPFSAPRSTRAATTRAPATAASGSRRPLLVAAGLLLFLCAASCPAAFLFRDGIAEIAREAAGQGSSLGSGLAEPTPTRSLSPTSSPAPSRTAPSAWTYQEGFDQPGDWSVAEFEDRRYWLENGEYHLLVGDANQTAWVVRTTQRYGDLVLAAIGGQVGAVDALYGLMFRCQDNDNFYQFLVSSDGRYRLRKRVAGEYIDLVAWTASPAINLGQTTNVLGIACQGPQIVAFVNDEVLAEVSDGSFAEGYIGLTAGSMDQGGAHVAFDEVRVQSIE